MKQLLKSSALLVGMVSLITLGCQEGPKNQSEQKEVVTFKAKDVTFSRQSAKCQGDGNCAKVSAVYPQLETESAAIAARINDTIFHYLSASLAVFSIEENEIITDLDTIAHRFIQDYEELLQETPDYSMAWEVSTEGKLLFQNGQVLSVELSNYSFTGGAHPNSYLTYLNFDAQTGEKLENEDWILDVEQLTEKAELKFRKVMELGPDDNLNEAGFFFGNSFSLPENIGFDSTGLAMYYNPYEAAAYAVGPISFVLEYNELENVILANFINE